MVDRASASPAVRVVPARVGLVGNPSDGYGGAVLGTVVAGLEATVSAAASAGISIYGPEPTERWPNSGFWERDVSARGHPPGQRIISAALWSLVRHLRALGIVEAGGPGVRLEWTTNIPRSVGLAGSSALAVATIDATASAWGFHLNRRVLAALALAAERDVLGIAAGWQDRIIQAFGRAALVDAARMDVVDGLDVPAVSLFARRAADPAGSCLVVGWSDAAAGASDDYHAPLREAAASLVVPMSALAVLAREAAAAWRSSDIDRLRASVDAGWAIRQACAPLRPDHAALVESVRATGHCAATPGSGGAVVAVCPDESSALDAVSVLSAAGCTSVRTALF